MWKGLEDKPHCRSLIMQSFFTSTAPILDEIVPVLGVNELPHIDKFLLNFSKNLLFKPQFLLYVPKLRLFPISFLGALHRHRLFCNILAGGLFITDWHIFSSPLCILKLFEISRDKVLLKAIAMPLKRSSGALNKSKHC